MSFLSTDTIVPSGAPPKGGRSPGYDLRPSRGLFDLELSDVWRARELLFVLMMRDVQVLYRQAILGVAWAIIQPVFAVIIFTIIFGHFARIASDGLPYSVFAFAGVLIWTYFSESVRRSATALVTDAELVRKIYFPRLIIPLGSVIAPLIEFSIGFVILLLLMFWHGLYPSWHILAIPPLLLVAGALALSMGLWLGPLNVRFRDIKHTLPFMLQIWMYASPIVYPPSIVPPEWRWAYSLNPMVGVIDGFRWAVFGQGQLNLDTLGISVVIIAALLVSGLVFFKRQERVFADVI